MEQLWWDASVWIALALISSLVSLRIGISAALVELIVGIIAGNSFHLQVSEWINFLASFGAIILTFLAGAELESRTLKRFWKESLVLGIIGFFAPFALSWAAAQFLLGWDLRASQIAGIAMSTTDAHADLRHRRLDCHHANRRSVPVGYSNAIISRLKGTPSEGRASISRADRWPA